jgi:hypothetical protein
MTCTVQKYVPKQALGFSLMSQELIEFLIVQIYFILFET